MAFGIAKQAPVGTAKYTLDIILHCERFPVLEVRYAGKGNGPYMSAVLKRSNDPQIKRMGAGKLTERKLEMLREIDAEILAHTVLVGWEDVAEVEAPGVPVPFSVEKAEELLLELARERPDLFDSLVSFARTPENFPNFVDLNTGVELGKK